MGSEAIESRRDAELCFRAMLARRWVAGMSVDMAKAQQR